MLAADRPEPMVPNLPVSFLSEVMLLLRDERLSATEYLSLLVNKLGTDRFPYEYSSAAT